MSKKNISIPLRMAGLCNCYYLKPYLKSVIEKAKEEEESKARKRFIEGN